MPPQHQKNINIPKLNCKEPSPQKNTSIRFYSPLFLIFAPLFTINGTNIIYKQKIRETANGE
jgi:hypothetical protein